MIGIDREDKREREAIAAEKKSNNNSNSKLQNDHDLRDFGFLRGGRTSYALLHSGGRKADLNPTTSSLSYFFWYTRDINDKKHVDTQKHVHYRIHCKKVCSVGSANHNGKKDKS